MEVLTLSAPGFGLRMGRDEDLGAVEPAERVRRQAGRARKKESRGRGETELAEAPASSARRCSAAPASGVGECVATQPKRRRAKPEFGEKTPCRVQRKPRRRPSSPAVGTAPPSGAVDALSPLPSGGPLGGGDQARAGDGGEVDVLQAPLGDQPLTGTNPVLGGQLEHPVDGPARGDGEHLLEVELGVEPVHLAGHDQGGEGAGALGVVVAAVGEPVAASLDRTRFILPMSRFARGCTTRGTPRMAASWTSSTGKCGAGRLRSSA